MGIVYNSFITENIAPPEVKCISVYNSHGQKVGTVDIPQSFQPTVAEFGEKLYSFGAISDVHLSVTTSETDLANALQYFAEYGASFVCVCGDITDNGNDTQFEKYREIISPYSNNMSVYAVIGNHDTYTYWEGVASEGKTEELIQNPFYYSFTQGNDVFIMLGIQSEGELFTSEELAWFKQTLITNSDKRCFVFQHCLLGWGNTETCGNANSMYENQTWGSKTNSDVHAAGQSQMTDFIEALQGHPNVIWFHGHSHLKFRFQTANCIYANYDMSDGFRSVHIPSVTSPRIEDGNDNGSSPDYDYSGSEGYIVDVYEKGILLKGRDFVSGKFLPIATYWINISKPININT